MSQKGLKIFEYCCKQCETEAYSVIHSPRPLPLSEEMEEVVEQLLWYVPNITSKQSKEKKMISEKIYDEFTFTLMKEVMQLKDEDVFVQPTNIDPFLRDFYQGEICHCCQKIVMKKASHVTFLSTLLRHIRNAIAHGNFTILENGMFVGFDENINTLTEKGSGVPCTAIIKIFPKNLLAGLKLLDTIYVREALLMHAFSKVGYTVEVQEDKHIRFDFMLMKNNKKIYVEVKRSQTAMYLDSDLFDSLYDYLLESKKDIKEPVVYMMDTAKLTIKQKQKLLNTNITILDRSAIQTLLKGIDVLRHIS